MSQSSSPETQDSVEIIRNPEKNPFQKGIEVLQDIDDKAKRKLQALLFGVPLAAGGGAMMAGYIGGAIGTLLAGTGAAGLLFPAIGTAALVTGAALIHRGARRR